MAKREDVVRIAAEQVGSSEPQGDDKYIDWFIRQTGAGFALSGTAWCSIWATWVYSMAGVDTVPVTAGCTTARRWWIGAGKWRAPGEYMPRLGDAIYFDWDASGDCDHVGIVERVEGGRVYTIEGNTNSAVRRRVYALTDSRIAGYGLPDFEEEDDDDMDLARFKELWFQLRAELQDNDSSEYSEAARAWAQTTGLIQGNGQAIEGAPNCMWEDLITREQNITVLYRFAQLMGLV